MARIERISAASALEQIKSDKQLFKAPSGAPDSSIIHADNRLPAIKAKTREAILSLEASMLAMPERQIDCEVKHYHASGVYVREFHAPAGAVITGKIHKTEHINIISKGKVWVVTEHSGKEYFEAPHTYISPVGSKKALYVLEDLIWLTCHRTDETDEDALETQFVADSYEEFEQFLLEHKGAE